jgi:hypothetical protein
LIYRFRWNWRARCSGHFLSVGRAVLDWGRWWEFRIQNAEFRVGCGCFVLGDAIGSLGGFRFFPGVGDEAVDCARDDAEAGRGDGEARGF